MSCLAPPLHRLESPLIGTSYWPALWLVGRTGWWLLIFWLFVGAFMDTRVPRWAEIFTSLLWGMLLTFWEERSESERFFLKLNRWCGLSDAHYTAPRGDMKSLKLCINFVLCHEELLMVKQFKTTTLSSLFQCFVRTLIWIRLNVHKSFSSRLIHDHLYFRMKT